MKLSVIMPVYNERATIERIIARVQAVPVDKELVIVDDGSADGTRDILKRYEGAPNVRICYHDRNRGKGAGIRTGIAECRGDIVIIQDADLEYDPKDYPALVEMIACGRADVVYGSRFLGAPHRTHMFWHFAANRFLTLVSNMFTNLNLTDMETCYKVFKAKYAPRLVLRSDRFGFDPEITARLARMKCRFYEVPISYYGRDYAEGKKITWKDGFVVLWAILKYNIWDR